MTGLQYGPIGNKTLHVAIDMQRLFAEPGDWYTPSLSKIVENVIRITQHNTTQTVFTRFITPKSEHEAQGVWQHYYRHWVAVTQQHMAVAKLDLIEPLQAYTPAATTIDKTTYDVFQSQAFIDLLHDKKPDTLVFTGVETDVCVFASVLSAVDQGYRVIVVIDAVTSSSEQAHKAVIDLILPRFEQQIEAVKMTELLKYW